MLKLFISLLAFLFVFSSNLFASKVSLDQCSQKGDNFIYAGQECIEFRSFEGDSNEHIMIIVHGTWDEGTNTLGRYAPFAETMNLNTDLTTIAIALPGYSNSSTNKFLSLASKIKKNQAATKEYVVLLGEIIKALKNKFKAKKITFVGHSAGARMGATLSALEPNLMQNVVLVGGRYEVREENKNKGFISFMDLIKKANKKTKYLFIYGTEDKISKPELTTKFFKIAKKEGLNARLVKVIGSGHIDLDMTDKAVEAITSLVEEE